MAKANDGFFDPYNLEPYREKIKQLYIQENRTLKDVMDIMKQEGLQATKNMYLKKLSSWGLEKNNRRKDMLELLPRIPDEQMKKDPSTQSFHVRGRNITAAQVLRYFHRKELDNKSTTIPAHVLFQSTEFQLSNPGVTPSLRQPEPFAKIQIFLEASLNAQGWLQNTQIRLYKDKPNPIQESIFDGELIRGLRILRSGQAVAGGARIERAFQSIGPLIRHAYPFILADLFQVLENLNEMKFTDFGPILIKYIYETAKTELGSMHALTRFFKALLDHFNIMETLRRGSKICYETSKRILGRKHPTTINYHGVYVFMLRRDTNARDEFSAQCKDLIQTAESSGEALLALNFKRLYASYLFHRGDRQGGLDLLFGITRELFNSPQPSLEILTYVFNATQEYVHYTLERLKQEGSKETELPTSTEFTTSEALMKTCVERSIMAYGPKHPTTVNTAQGLGEFYLEWGVEDKSQTQFDYIITMMEEFHLKHDEGLSH